MLKIFKKRLTTRRATTRYPLISEEAPEKLLGAPVIDFEKTTPRQLEAAERVCPTGAISLERKGNEVLARLSYARCIFCGRCADAVPEAITITNQFELAAFFKERLTQSATYLNDRVVDVKTPLHEESLEALGNRVHDEITRIFGRSLHIREVDAGSCNGCELEIAALQNPVYDLERFGLHFVASPRHADLLLVTGPVTRNLAIALQKTYEATPDPKHVVAVGACACSGGIFGRSYASLGGVDKALPVDLYIPGCPPRPQAILKGLLMVMEKF